MKIKLLVQILLSSFILSTLAAVPSEINYQGLITDSDGDPIESATNSVAVNLYQVETGGTAEYTQSFTQVASDAYGIYSIQIVGASLQSVLETNNELWLELIINEETLTPRQEIHSVPYALVAKSAESFAPDSDASIAMTTLQTDVDQNESDADAAIAALQTENINRQYADNSLGADLNAEATSRTAADLALQADIDQNESDADTAIADLQAENVSRPEKEPVEYVYDTNQNINSFTGAINYGPEGRILLTGQTDLSQNGIYVRSGYISNDGLNNPILVRTQDFDEASEMQAGAFVFVTSGNSSGKGYVLTQSVYIYNNLDYSSVNFKRFTYDQELDAFDTSTLSSKAPVQAVKETNIVLSTSYSYGADKRFNEYNNPYETGDRILFMGQDSAKENGIYEVISRSPYYPDVHLSRARDLNEQDEFFGGIFVFVEKGPLAGQGYILEALHDDFQLDASNYYGYHDINFSKFTIDTTSDISLSGNLTVTGSRVDFSSAQEVIVPTPEYYNEATNKAYVDAAVANNTSALAAETSARATAITALQAGVDQNESDADAAIATEASTARAAEQANADAIFSNTTNTSNNTTNISNNTTGIATNSTNISANTGNVTTNTTNITSNAAAITSEVARAEAVESALATAITAEASRAEAAEAALQADIDQNESDADAAIAALQAVDESSARQFVVDFGFTDYKSNLNSVYINLEQPDYSGYYSCEVGDTVLLTGQSDSSENGIYEITNASGPNWGKTISLTRSSSYDTAEELNEGDLVLIEKGESNGLAFMLGAISETFVLGNDALTWYRCGINTNQDIDFAGTVSAQGLSVNTPGGYIIFDGMDNRIYSDFETRFDGNDVRFTNDEVRFSNDEVHFENYGGVDFDTNVQFGSTVTLQQAPTQDNEVANKLYVDTAVSTNTSAVAAETSARATAITALQTDVDQNESDADAAIAAEASTARAAEQANTDAITAEVARAEAAEAALQTDIDQNESDADAAIAALQAVDASSARQFVVDFGFTDNQFNLSSVYILLVLPDYSGYYSCEVGDTVLLTGQSDSSENGIYEITSVSGIYPSNKNVSLVRSTNYDSAEEFNEGDLVLIEKGTSNGLAFMLGAISETFVLGNDALTWYRCGINTSQDIEFTGIVTVTEIQNNPTFGNAEFRLGEYDNYIRLDMGARFNFEGGSGSVRFRDGIDIEFQNYGGVDFDTDVEFTSTVTVQTPTQDNEVANKAYVDSVVVPSGGLIAWPVASGIPTGWSDSGLSSPMADYIWIRKD